MPCGCQGKSKPGQSTFVDQNGEKVTGTQAQVEAAQIRAQEEGRTGTLTLR